MCIQIVISTFPKRYLKAKSTRAPAYSRALRRFKEGFQRGVKRSSGPIFRIPGGDRVAVKVSVVQMGWVNDQMGQGWSVWRDDILILSGRSTTATHDQKRGDLALCPLAQTWMNMNSINMFNNNYYFIQFIDLFYFDGLLGEIARLGSYIGPSYTDANPDPVSFPTSLLPSPRLPP